MSDRGKATPASDCVSNHGRTMIAGATSANATANAVQRNTRVREDGERNGTADRRRGGTAGFAGGGIESRSRSSGNVFRRGDEAYCHRARLPDGRLNCASRFRLDPTYSLLAKVRMGRNLITLFSTVNTPCEKKVLHRTWRARPTTRESIQRAPHAVLAPAQGRFDGKRKNAFFQRFHLRCATPAQLATRRRGTLDIGNASSNAARESTRYEIVGAVEFRRHTTPIARICANFERRFDTREGIASASRTWFDRH